MTITLLIFSKIMEFFTCFIFWLFFLEGNKKVETEDLTQIPTLTLQNSTSFCFLCELSTSQLKPAVHVSLRMIPFPQKGQTTIWNCVPVGQADW